LLADATNVSASIREPLPSKESEIGAALYELMKCLHRGSVRGVVSVGEDNGNGSLLLSRIQRGRARRKLNEINQVLSASQTLIPLARFG
jgi:hypothetical protein